MRRTELSRAMDVAVAGSPVVPAALPAMVKVLGCCLLVGLAAQVRVLVPGTDVPMTLQSSAVLLAGLALCPSQAAAAMLVYLFAGAAGVPMFAPGSAGVLGPTGGYIVGFVPAAWLVSVLRGGRGASYPRLLLAGAVGTAVIFVVGALWPGRVAFYGGDVGAAVATGVLPFSVKAVVQLLLAVTLAASVRRMRGGGRRPGAL